MPEIVITEFMYEAAIHASFAGRDVLYDPKLVDDPARLAGLANLILTPHIAGVTEESNVRVSAVTAEAVARHLGA